MKVFAIADTHFFHTNIIEYCGRPFRGMEEMNEFLLDNWNKVVSPWDLVMHLGDVSLTHYERVPELVHKLNGTKVLVMGNHDHRQTMSFWYSCGFELVKRCPYILGSRVFSHEPQHVAGNQFNWHGHSHGQWAVPGANHKCVSVECIQYTPIEIKLGG